MKNFAYSEDYLISPNTMAVSPFFEEGGQSRIYERNSDIMVVGESAMNIISEGCLLGGASYEGRKDAVKYRTDIKCKLPVPMNVLKRIGAMPTHSPRTDECHWLFPYHIKFINPHPDTKFHSEVVFLDGQTLRVNISPYSLKLQKMRATEAFSIFFYEDAR
ncbi:competence protein ComK [Alteribacillus sp. YIM 98480]|uniref:competence protein ComK n=1 Tax=Alteribacillus sp. YIM 98480 TaxID=2606599 RepID=UPI00131D7858|nr:competence protein ComK [Alteribacillus sp. YIM 98480]